MSRITPPNCTILDNWVFQNFMLADESLAKALRIIETYVSVKNNLCEKLVLSLESPATFDEIFIATSVPFFILDFSLVSYKLDNFKFKVFSWVILFWCYIKTNYNIKVLNIPEFSICQNSEFLALHRVYLYSWIWLGSEYASWCNYGWVLNIPGFRICQVSTYASVTQGSKYAWIWLNNAWINCLHNDRVLDMSGQSFTGFSI